MKYGKRFLIFFATLALAFAMVPATGFAAYAEDDVQGEPTPDAVTGGGDQPAVGDAEADDAPADDTVTPSDGSNGSASTPSAGAPAAAPAQTSATSPAPTQTELAAAPAAAPADEVVLAAEETEVEPTAEAITSVSINATNPVCGTFVKCQGATMYWPPNYQPAPPLSVDTPNCSIFGAWWVEGNGPDTAHVYPRNRDITVDGTKWYKFVLNLHPDEGYDFTPETAVTISTGSVLSQEFYPGDQWNDSAIIAVFEIPAKHEEVTEITNVVKPTCTQAGSHHETVTCTVCGTTVRSGTVTDPATGHKWGEWTVSRNPTATEPGELVRVCQNDPTHTETQTIPPTGGSAADDGSAGGPVERGTGGSGTVTSQNVVPASSAVAGSVDNGLTTITDEGNPTVSGIDGNVQFGVPAGGVVAHAAIWIAIAAAAVIALFIVFFRRKKSGVDEG